MPLDTQKQWFRIVGVAFFKVSSFLKKLGTLLQKLIQNGTKCLKKCFGGFPKTQFKTAMGNTENLMKKGLQHEV